MTNKQETVVIELTDRQDQIMLTSEEVRVISLMRALVSERFGSLLVTVHDSRVVGVEATTKIRF